MLVIIGLFVGVIWANFKRVEGNTFKLFGYTIIFEKPKKNLSEVVPFKKKEKPVAAPKDECELCHGKDLYINKSIMACPKCQRNKSRVKSV